MAGALRSASSKCRAMYCSVNQGSLYPALQRLERRGLVTSEWRASDNNRRSKLLPAAPSGRAELSREQKDWERFMGAVQRIMRAV